MIVWTMGALASAQALDGRLTLGLELGHDYVDQPEVELFEGNALMLGLGSRVQLRVHDNVQIVVSALHGQRGGTLAVPGFDGGDDVVRTVLSVDEVGLGPRAEIEVNEMFSPYVMAQGLVWSGLVRLDDQPGTASNDNQLRAGGVTGGLAAVVGFEIRVPDHWFTVYGELGHRWLARTSIGELGTLRPRGYVHRLGVAVRL